MKKSIVMLLFTTITMQIYAGWAEDTLASMSLKEKVGQLFIASATEDLSGFETDIDLDAYYKNLIETCHVGGFIHFAGTFTKQVPFTNQLQRWSKLPLLMAQDGEWGLNMRLKDLMPLPKNMTLGAIQDDELIFAAGKMIGQQCRLSGIHLNFAPVVDINTNPKNPIIGIRSFGANKENVAHKGTLLMQGIQAGGCLACAKHFPGHGDTESDSHLCLPVINHDATRIHEEELFPFREIINHGVAAIMTAHLAIPALRSPSSSSLLSRHVVHTLLQKKLGFTGLVVTDGMTMKGVSAAFKAEDAALLAVLAGNDLILCPPMIASSIEHIIQAVNDGVLSLQDLNAKVLKILQAKERLGLHQERLVNESTTLAIINNPEILKLRTLLYEKAVTVINNAEQILPLNPDDRTLFINIGAVGADEQGTTLSLDASNEEIEAIVKACPTYKNVVVRCFQLHPQQGRYGRVPGIAPAIANLFDQLSNQPIPTVIMLATSPYALEYLPSIPTVITYEQDPDAQAAGMKVVWGEITAKGILPIHRP